MNASRCFECLTPLLDYERSFGLNQIGAFSAIVCDNISPFLPRRRCHWYTWICLRLELRRIVVALVQPIRRHVLCCPMLKLMTSPPFLPLCLQLFWLLVQAPSMMLLSVCSIILIYFMFLLKLYKAQIRRQARFLLQTAPVSLRVVRLYYHQQSVGHILS